MTNTKKEPTRASSTRLLASHKKQTEAIEARRLTDALYLARQSPSRCDPVAVQRALAALQGAK